MSARAGKVCIVQYNASKYLTRVDRAARALAEDGWEVVLVALKDDDTPAIEERDGYVVKRVTLRSRRLPRGFGLKFLRFAEGIWRTFATAWREDADVYDARDAYPLLACHLAARLRGALLVYDADELALGRNWTVAANPAWRWAMKRYEGFYLRRAATVITSDAGRADFMAAEHGVSRPIVVRNVPETIEEPDPDEEFRRRALGGKRFLLIYQGVLIPNRGLPELIDAMRELRDCRLALVGYGSLEGELRAKVERERLQASVEVFDAVPYERLMRYTAAADVGLIPLVGSCLSYVYAAPNKLFEYMMVGLPVVVSDLPDMAAVVREERVGTLIGDPRDPSSIAAAVRELLDGAEDIGAVGARAREAALARHRWELERDVLLRAFRSLPLRGTRPR
ncbi:MAG: glycosyltransferase family 4 protein, partial [Coriobacteriia bacterium]